MTTFGSAGPVTGDAGRPRLERALWRAKADILALAVGAGLVTFIALPQRGPLSLLVGLAAAFLAIAYFVVRDLIGREAETSAEPSKRNSFQPARHGRAKQAPIAARAEPSAQSAAGFLERFRQSLAHAGGEAEEAAPEFGARGFTRFRLGGKNIPEKGEAAAGANGGNELRHYLNNGLSLRLAASVSGARKTGILAPQTRSGAESAVLASLDAVLDHILAACQGAAPRALLVCGGPTMADATAEAISIARTLVAAGGQVVLLDLAHGPSSVSGALGLPRSPGLTDLSAGRVRFEDIIGIDAETPLHVIAAGNPRFAASADEDARFAPIFEALIETYDSVVLYADREALRRLAAERRFEFPIVVAVLPAGTSATPDLSDFAALGSQFVAYEQGGKVQSPRFLGWAAAI